MRSYDIDVVAINLAGTFSGYPPSQIVGSRLAIVHDAVMQCAGFAGLSNADARNHAISAKFYMDDDPNMTIRNVLKTFNAVGVQYYPLLCKSTEA